MSRLTRRADGIVFYPHCEDCEDFNCINCDFDVEISKKLAHYEDLEEQGRLTELPCKAGDKLWVISESKAEECQAVEFNISAYGASVMTEHNCDYDCEGCPFGSLRKDYSGEYSCEGEYGTGFFKVEDFGKTVFLTKAEAEVKLAELKGGDE